MAATKAELITVDQVMAFYEMHGNTVCFVIYAGISMKHEQICFDFLDYENPEEGEVMLRKFLDLIKSRTDNTNMYTIQLVDSFKEVDSKAGKIKVFTGRSMRFQLNQAQPYNEGSREIIIKNEQGQIIPQEGNSEVTQLLKQLLNEQKQENEKLRLLLEERENNSLPDYEEEEEEEEEIVTPQKRIMGVVANMLERDETQEAIAGILLSGQKWLTDKLFTPKNTPNE